MEKINVVIARNISNLLRQQSKKQNDLANALGTTKQTVSKMLNGSRMINAIELKQIADFLNVKMDELTKMPTVTMEKKVVHVFMGKVTSEEGKKALEIADELSKMILFHKKVRDNNVDMIESWGDD